MHSIFGEIEKSFQRLVGQVGDRRRSQNTKAYLAYRLDLVGRYHADEKSVS